MEIGLELYIEIYNEILACHVLKCATVPLLYVSNQPGIELKYPGKA